MTRNSALAGVLLGLAAFAAQAAPILDTVVARITARVDQIETYEASAAIVECSG